MNMKKTCSSNDKNKKCATCKYCEEHGYPISGSDERCMNEKAPTFGFSIWTIKDDMYLKL